MAKSIGARSTLYLTRDQADRLLADEQLTLGERTRIYVLDQPLTAAQLERIVAAEANPASTDERVNG